MKNNFRNTFAYARIIAFVGLAAGTYASFGPWVMLAVLCFAHIQMPVIE